MSNIHIEKKLEKKLINIYTKSQVFSPRCFASLSAEYYALNINIWKYSFTLKF